MPKDILRYMIDKNGCYGNITELGLQIERWRRMYLIFQREDKIVLFDKDEKNHLADILFFMAHEHIICFSDRNGVLVQKCGRTQSDNEFSTKK